ncbi:hypothetical protein Ami103574_08270 [Aminipila butyrica]|uniref:DNA mismatch repair proteins mutS family domain-containing protein n=1 Tax=Aminipila butyrica TaxID=433296 RepID=A0A858BW37_9FIRM|nr:hypothetical protein [Aminipila butyrica]QIB69318.1 hypothetical protein Ami103574_08270 [Aminipila butyrica]
MSSSSRKLRQEKLRERFGKNPAENDEIFTDRNQFDKIKIYHDEKCEQFGEAEIDDITWNDLEMDQVFLRMNNTKSYIGEQILYHRLHDLDRCRDWSKLENQIRYYTENEPGRIQIEEKLVAIGKQKEDYYLPTFLMNPEYWHIQNSFILHLLQVCLSVFIAGSIFTNNTIFLAGLLIVAPINLMVYLTTKQSCEVYLYSLGSLKQLLKFSKMVMSNDKWREIFATEEIESAIMDLNKLSRMIVYRPGRKYASIPGDLLGILQDYLLGITLYDIATFNYIMKIINQKQDNVLKLYEFAGNIDMGIAIASFRKSKAIHCQPQFIDVSEIHVQGISHPLIEQAITNDFTLKDRAIITGANASGKSTFMKALAVNIIMAQTLHTCTAKSFQLPMLQVMTSMSLRDDILTGESYYIKEVKYLKRMLDQTNSPILTLFIIDEILRGTNTEERMAAASAILDYFAYTKSLIIVATHDMELVSDMKDKYENFYFDSYIDEQEVKFDYCIYKGIGGKSNAIELLSLLHFPEEIVQAAKNNIGGVARENWRGC